MTSVDRGPAAKPEGAPVPTKPAQDEKPDRRSTVGAFIQSYSGFLSTFVIGAAGLIATSIWQYKQSEIARRQAESQETMARTQADNQWRIERAEILSKNLQVLASRGDGSVDQRYGVLLSLTRGEIIDPELAVSYALELGKDNPEYMKSVLTSTTNKDYAQLSHAFVLTCEQRYGLTRPLDLCKADVLGPRSDAIARLFADETETWLTTGDGAHRAPDGGIVTAQGNPLVPLRDERAVQKEPARMAWLYTPLLLDLYQRRQWAELRAIEGLSNGARAIVALVVATARTEELRSESEGEELLKLHVAARTWLAGYLLGMGCDDDCRGRFVEFMLTNYAESGGDYNDLMQQLLARPPSDSGPSFARLHARLGRCQALSDDITAFRDGALVPTLGDALASKKIDAVVIDNLVDLLALVPEPEDPTAQAAFHAVLDRLLALYPDKYRKSYLEQRASAEAERRVPPPALKRTSFCAIPNATDNVRQPE